MRSWPDTAIKRLASVPSASAAPGRRIALWPRSPPRLRLRANRTCCSLRGASVAACTAYTCNARLTGVIARIGSPIGSPPIPPSLDASAPRSPDARTCPRYRHMLPLRATSAQRTSLAHPRRAMRALQPSGAGEGRGEAFRGRTGTAAAFRRLRPPIAKAIASRPVTDQSRRKSRSEVRGPKHLARPEPSVA